MMAKIVIEKGTQTLELEVGPSNWSGDLFQANQKQKMALLPANTIINTKHGTVGVKASEYPKSRYKRPSRLRISSAGGTKIITL